VIVTAATSKPLSFTFAISSYDHVEDLVEGRVQIEGAEPLFIRLPIPEMFRRFVTTQDWDVSEMSFVNYGTMRANGDDRVIGIPAFPSRLYRQSAIFVRSDVIKSPEDLRGARVGLPAWANSAGVWARGLLADMHGIRPADVTWYQGGIERPGRVENVPARHLSDDIAIVRVVDRGLEEMLWAGDIDALILPAPPPSLDTSVASGGLVRLLYSDLEAAEGAYRAKTGCLPMMHVVAVSAELHQREPSILLRVYDAMETARREYFERLRSTEASHVPLPWSELHLEEVDRDLGMSDWAYGIEPNRQSIQTYLRYVRDQGLIPEGVTPEDLFPEWLAAMAERDDETKAEG
jgi:4,5-dihydroxyphthalate decarboxylase